MFHVKHSKSNPVIWFGFSQYYLRETRPEPPPSHSPRPRCELLALSPCSVSENACRAPKPGPVSPIPGPVSRLPLDRGPIRAIARYKCTDRDLSGSGSRLIRSIELRADPIESPGCRSRVLADRGPMSLSITRPVAGVPDPRPCAALTELVCD